MNQMAYDDFIPSMEMITGKSERRIKYERLLSMAFDVNADHYVDLDWRMRKEKIKFNICWLAILFPAVWLCYRKLWVEFVIIAALSIIVAVSAFIFSLISTHHAKEISIASNVVVIFINIMIACRVKIYYVKKINKMIARIGDSAMPAAKARERIIKNGGVSILGAIFGILFSMSPFLIVGVIAVMFAPNPM